MASTQDRRLSSATWQTLEAITHRDPGGRGLASFRHEGKPLDAGQLAAAAESLCTARGVAIVTGFAVVHNDLVRGETDGPPGALYLVRALAALGIPVSLISDDFSIAALQAGCDLWQLKDIQLACFDRSITADWCREFFARQQASLSHLIAIERPGPSHTVESLRQQARSGPAPTELFEAEVPIHDRNACHTMRGLKIDAHVAPSHQLFELARHERLPLTTIGIFDGGNEIGAGSILWEVLRRAIAQGPAGKVACRIATDFTLLGGVSNWAAYALALAVAVLRGERTLASAWDEASQQQLLQCLVEKGGLVDGVTGRAELSVDGLSCDEYLRTLSELRTVLELSA